MGAGQQHRQRLVVPRDPAEFDWEPTFGLIAVDRATFGRSPKPSLRWLGALAPAGR